ncbi:MAG: hypothetical protein FJ125_03075 [Deltaproteobacteria bacterium]|nr:hypothetical protein [Deltaproteobacteria bacterium]
MGAPPVPVPVPLPVGLLGPGDPGQPLQGQPLVAGRVLGQALPAAAAEQATEKLQAGPGDEEQAGDGDGVAGQPVAERPRDVVELWRGSRRR